MYFCLGKALLVLGRFIFLHTYVVMEDNVLHSVDGGVEIPGDDHGGACGRC